MKSTPPIVRVAIILLLVGSAACQTNRTGTGPSGKTVLDVNLATNGDILDPDGYLVSVDRGPGQAVGINDAVEFPNLAAGNHTVELSGVASNCSVSGSNPRTVSVTENDTTSTSFDITCEATSGGATYPNEPSSSTTINENPWDSLPFSGSEPDDNCWLRTDFTESRMAVASDSSAPQSPANVLQLTHPESLGGDGVTVWHLWTDDPRFSCGANQEYRDLYVSFHMKLMPDWLNEKDGGKIWFFRLPEEGFYNGRNTPFLSLVNDNDSGSQPDADVIEFQFNLQDLPADWGTVEEYPTNMNTEHANLGTESSLGDRRGEWIHVEVLLRLNTTGDVSDGTGGDGEFHLWVNGTKTHEYTGIMYQDPADDWGWAAKALLHTYGGRGGDGPPYDQWIRYDHTYISGDRPK